MGFIKVVGLNREDIIIAKKDIHSVVSDNGGLCIIYATPTRSHWYNVRTPFEEIWKQLQ